MQLLQCWRNYGHVSVNTYGLGTIEFTYMYTFLLKGEIYSYVFYCFFFPLPLSRYTTFPLLFNPVVYIYIYIYIYIYVYMYMYMYIYIYIHVYVYIFIYIFIQTHTHIYTYIYIYIYIYHWLQDQGDQKHYMIFIL